MQQAQQSTSETAYGAYSLKRRPVVGLWEETKDVPMILEHLSDDIDCGIEAKASTEVPWHGTGKGKKFAAEFFAKLDKACTFTRFEPSGFLGSEDAVACLISFDATINKNGRKSSQNVIHHFTIKNGRVTRWRGWEDTAHTKSVWNS